MTNAGEARLCREAEIAMATLALVTDYDCWKNEEAAVDVASVIANLQANGELAKDIIRSVIPTIPDQPGWPEHSSLGTAILTPRENWPDSLKLDLAPLLSRFS